MNIHRALLFSLVLLLTTACQSRQDASLYQQLGEQQGLERLVDAFINQIGHDQQVIHYFKDTNISHFRTGFIQHLCSVVGGPCEYTGDNMVDIHTGMHINERDFNHVVDLLINAMTEVGLPTTAQNKVLYRLAPFRSDIISL